jgi:hypothetical protein
MFSAVGAGQDALRPDPRPYDKRNLSGFWKNNLYGYNGKFVPPMTPDGQKKFDSYKPSYGRALGSQAAAEHPEEPIGRRRAVPPALGNDPVGNCNPLGLIRLLLYQPSPIEIIQTPERMLQMFEWTWDRREVWTDGRPLAKVEEYLPRFNGYSVGRWEGDTFVVDTIGFDDRQWIDHFGYPISEQARLQERWRRTAYNILELRMTLTDSSTYTQPWESEVSTFRLVTKEDLGEGTGWGALVEDRCVPFDEVNRFNKQVRDPAGGVK